MCVPRFPVVVGLRAECIARAGRERPPGAARAGRGAMTMAPRSCPELIAAINAARAAEGLPPLVPHPAVEGAALAHAADLLGNGAFDHAGSDRSLPLERVMRQGLTPRLAAENIAMGQPDAWAAVAAWQGSPGHRANNLSPEATLVGAAEARYGRRGFVSDDQLLWIAVFAAPF